MYRRRSARKICFSPKIAGSQTSQSKQNLIKKVDLKNKLIPEKYFQSKIEVAQIKEDNPVCRIVPPKKRASGRLSDISPSNSGSIKKSRLSMIQFDSKREVAVSPTYNPKSGEQYVHQVYYNKTKVAQGSFGQVFKAISKDDGKIYAIKKFLTESHPKRTSYKEIQNMEKILPHFNIIRYIMSWEEQGEIYSVMEACQLSLGQYTYVVNQVPEAQLLEILNDISEALFHLHKTGFIHLDVKPDNILIDKGFYKLCDFGLLREIGRPIKPGEEFLNEGDSKYLAPEVLSQEVFSPQVDIFALGITIIEAATGLFMPSYGDLWHEIRSGKVPDTLPQLISSQLLEMVILMVDPNWERRPTSSYLTQCPLAEFVKNNDKNFPRQDLAKNISAPYANMNTSLSELNANIDNNANIGGPFLKTDPLELDDTTDSINIINKLHNTTLCDDEDRTPKHLRCSENNNEQNLINKNRRSIMFDASDENAPIMETPKENVRPRRLPRMRLFDDAIMHEF